MNWAVEAAKGIGERCLAYFSRAGYQLDHKADGSPVTTADREAEQAFRAGAGHLFPNDLILGEEFGASGDVTGVAATEPRFRWIIDPIDGTISFVHGVPLWGTLIGLELIQPGQSHGRLVGGVIHMPALREVVYAADGDGAWHVAEGREPVRARVSQSASVEASLICTTSHEYWARNNREHLYLPLCRAGKRSRGWSDCYAHLLVATGRADAVVEPGVHPWDVAATIPVIREAGGRCTDWQGVETPWTGTNLATNGRIHQPLLDLLSRKA